MGEKEIDLPALRKTFHNVVDPLKDRLRLYAAFENLTELMGILDKLVDAVVVLKERLDALEKKGRKCT